MPETWQQFLCNVLGLPVIRWMNSSQVAGFFFLPVTQASSSDGKEDCVTGRKEQPRAVTRFISIFITIKFINNSNYKKNHLPSRTQN